MVTLLLNQHSVGKYYFPWGLYVPASTATQRYLKTDMRVVDMGWSAERIIEVHAHTFCVKPGELRAVQSDGCKLWATLSYCCSFVKDSTIHWKENYKIILNKEMPLEQPVPTILWSNSVHLTVHLNTEPLGVRNFELPELLVPTSLDETKT